MDPCTDSSGRASRRRQRVGDRLFYYFDFSLRAVDAWEPNTGYAANALVRPTEGQETGWLYQQGAAPGLSGPLEPLWLTSGTVQDGSCVWTPVAPPATEDTIQTVTWEQVEPPDDTFVIDGQVSGATTAGAYLSVGTPGSGYLVRCTVTMASGAVYTADILVEVV